MSIELPDKKTPLEPKQVFQGLYLAWLKLFNEVPKRDSLLVLLSQSTLESGAKYKSCHNFNLGNQKSINNDGKDYCYFACNEILQIDYANKLAKANPDTVKITLIEGNKATVWFYPKHPGCCFRAYTTLEVGILDYLELLHKRFNKSWQAVLDGDPAKFVIALKAQGYFTANLNDYMKSVVSLFNQYKKDPNLSTDGLPILSDQQKDKIEDLVTITAQDSVKEDIENTKPVDPVVDVPLSVQNDFWNNLFILIMKFFGIK